MKLKKEEYLTFLCCKIVRVANFKRDLLREYWSDLKSFGVHMKAENLRNPKMVLHVPIAAPKLEL